MTDNWDDGEVGEFVQAMADRPRIENCCFGFGVGVDDEGNIFVREQVIVPGYDGPALREFMARIVAAWSAQLETPLTALETASVSPD